MDERAADETVPLELDAVVEMAAAAKVMESVDEADDVEEDAALLEEADVEEVVAAAVEPPVREN